jgi:hypothetical protein
VLVLSVLSLFLVGMSAAVLATDQASAMWEGDVFSSGASVTTSVALLQGVRYSIVASGVWWYDWAGNVAADAQYYTTDFSESVFWGNYFPAPGGGSFLQINGQNVSWGTFSNGDSGNHTYTISFVGSGTTVTFRIVDLMDGNYDNNVCHIHLWIFGEVTVGGSLEDPSFVGTGAYVAAAVLICVCAVAFSINVHLRRSVKARQE